MIFCVVFAHKSFFFFSISRVLSTSQSSDRNGLWRMLPLSETRELTVSPPGSTSTISSSSSKASVKQQNISINCSVNNALVAVELDTSHEFNENNQNDSIIRSSTPTNLSVIEVNTQHNISSSSSSESGVRQKRTFHVNSGNALLLI